VGRITRKEFEKDWSAGAEPAAAIPGEPIEFYKADENLRNAEAELFDTPEGNYYIKRADGSLVYNPKTQSGLFDTAAEAKDEFLSTITKGELAKPPTVTKPPMLEGKDNPTTENDFLPMTPSEGPPLPRALGIRWPWRK